MLGLSDHTARKASRGKEVGGQFLVVHTAGQARNIALFTLILLFCVLGSVLYSLEENL